MEAANVTPADLAHRIDATVDQCGSQTRRMLFRLAAHRSIRLGRRVNVIGIRRGGRIVLCSRPDCHHTDEPFVVPAVDEIEWAANDPNYTRSPRAVEWHVPGIEIPYALGFNWPPGTHQVPWWSA